MRSASAAALRRTRNRPCAPLPCDVVFRIGVGKADIALPDIRRIWATDQCNACLVEQAMASFFGLPARFRHVGKGIEGAFGTNAGDTRQVLKEFRDDPAAAVKAATMLATASCGPSIARCPHIAPGR
jgi:hypothetical protein